MPGLISTHPKLTLPPLIKTQLQRLHLQGGPYPKRETVDHNRTQRHIYVQMWAYGKFN